MYTMYNILSDDEILKETSILHYAYRISNSEMLAAVMNLAAAN